MTEAIKKRRQTDWDACHRDYRTGKFTHRELADKYGVSHAAVRKQITNNGWEKDLGEEIRQATNAALARELVSSEVSKGVQEVSSVVFAAAEVNVRIIAGHRKRLAELHELADRAQKKLEEMSESLSDVREAAVFVQAAGNLTAIAKTLIEQERKAFGIDETERAADSIEDLILEAMGGKAKP